MSEPVREQLSKGKRERERERERERNGQEESVDKRDARDSRELIDVSSDGAGVVGMSGKLAKSVLLSSELSQVSTQEKGRGG